jgi:hypothetical protein
MRLPLTAEPGVAPTCRVNEHIYEIRTRPNHRSFDLISDVLPFGQLW